MKTNLSRDRIVDEYPFLTDEERPMVIGTDLDALLSGAFLSHHLGWEVIGFYDLTTLYVDPEEYDALEDAVWVDLDIYDDRYASIGHHIVSMRPDDNVPGFDNSINLNLERNVWGEGYRFTRKCPVGTIMFLSWLHDEEPEDSRWHWLADSAWINGQSHKYRENVGTWTTESFGSDWMADEFEKIDEKSFENRMGGLFENISQEMDPDVVDTGRSKSRHNSIGGWQFGFNDPRDFPVQEALELICGDQHWTIPSIPDEYVTVVGERNHRLGYDNEVLAEYRGMGEWLDDVQPFSYAVPYNGNINYTTGIDPGVLE